MVGNDIKCDCKGETTDLCCSYGVIGGGCLGLPVLIIFAAVPILIVVFIVLYLVYRHQRS